MNMRAAIISTGGDGAISGSAQMETRDLYSLCGFNTGNLAFWYGISRHIADEKDYIPWSFDPDEVREKYDILVFPAANQISADNDLGYFADRFERTGLPCIILGLGAQAPKIGAKFQIPAGTRRWLDIISERSTMLGVRGTYTAEVLSTLGIHNVEVTGCPSFFINPSVTLGSEIERKLFGATKQVAFCQGELNANQLGVEQKIFEWAYTQRAPYICQAPDRMVSLARGRLSELSRAEVEEIWRFLAPGILTEEFIQFAQQFFKVFFDATVWLEYLKPFDLSIGSRLHGNILAVQAGVPGIIVPHDSRTNELAVTGQLPIVDADTFLQCADIERIKDAVEFDGATFNKTRRELAARMAAIIRDSGLIAGRELSILSGGEDPEAIQGASMAVTEKSTRNVAAKNPHKGEVRRSMGAAMSYTHPLHVRSKGIWPQYYGLGTRLRGKIFYSDILQPSDEWSDWEGKPVSVVSLTEQRPETYHDTHNHYQLVLSEVMNFTPDTNAIPFWGDAAAIANGSGAWGAFFSARSAYYDPATMPSLTLGASAPEGFKAVPQSDFDCQLTGLEVDVLNGGKPGVYPNKAKHGIQIVGFGNPNSHALSVICENFDCEPEKRKGQFESGIYFQNSIHPDYGRVLVSDLTTARMGLDFSQTLFRSGAIQLKSEGPGTGIIFDDGRGGEIYTGTRWVGTETPRWQTIRMAEEGIRIVSPDGKRELLAIDAYGGVYLNGDLYINGRRFHAQSEASPGALLMQVARTLLQRILGWLQPSPDPRG
ncbi:polysaccharide pyruvyl transferase family protein [Microvirga sp. KLBC 81]|uniref:polysaccharide pyruvyl transferase family protein n=1 Tax=Microvirga sp. KLBC 81 TaxID=1862707 RepID=UPI0014024E60|nr:polysaccharide pyruvyl transferase family protein [Microvirga sp. KLBC 81]